MTPLLTFLLLLLLSQGPGLIGGHEDNCDLCPDGWSTIDSKEICYMSVNEQLGFEDAFARCPEIEAGASLLDVMYVEAVLDDVLDHGDGSIGVHRVNAIQVDVNGQWEWFEGDGTKIEDFDVDANIDVLTRPEAATVTIKIPTRTWQQKFNKGKELRFFCQLSPQGRDCTTTQEPEPDYTTTQPVTDPGMMRGEGEDVIVGQTYSGQVFSPNFGVGAYPRNWIANYKFQAQDYELVKVVGFYNLDEADASGACLDHLTIYDGQSLDDPVHHGPFCGQGSIPDLLIEPGSNGKLVRFQSDDKIHKSQSLFYLQSQVWSCGKQVGLVEGESVSLTSPSDNIPLDEPGCAYIVCAKKNQRVEARFNTHPDTKLYEVNFYDGNVEATRSKLHQTRNTKHYLTPDRIRTKDNACMTIELEYKTVGVPSPALNIEVRSVPA